MRKKGQIWISAVLYVLVIVALIIIVLEAGLPLLGRLKEKNSFNRVKDTLTALDSNIRQIAGEGQGSQRIVPVAVSIPGPAIMMRKKETLRKTDARVIIGKPIELPHIDGIEDFKRLLEKRASSEEITDADIARFKELSWALKGQSEMLMKTLARMLPEEKRGPYGRQESVARVDTSVG